MLSSKVDKVRIFKSKASGFGFQYGVDGEVSNMTSVQKILESSPIAYNVSITFTK